METRNTLALKNLLSYAKVIGKHHFSDSLAAVASCTAEKEREKARALAECTLTANEGENAFPIHVSPHRIH